MQKEGVKTHKEKVEELNKYLSNLSEHHDMYVPLLLGFRLGDRNADDMSITGRELDLDNTKLGDGRWEEGGLVFFCVVVIGTWCLGGIRGQREAYLGRKPIVQVPDILPCEGKGCMLRRVVHLAITNPRILPPQPFPKPQAAQTTDPNLPLSLPLTPHFASHMFPTNATPHD